MVVEVAISSLSGPSDAVGWGFPEPRWRSWVETRSDVLIFFASFGMAVGWYTVCDTVIKT